MTSCDEECEHSLLGVFVHASVHDADDNTSIATGRMTGKAVILRSDKEMQRKRKDGYSRAKVEPSY